MTPARGSIDRVWRPGSGRLQAARIVDAEPLGCHSGRGFGRGARIRVRLGGWRREVELNPRPLGSLAPIPLPVALDSPGGRRRRETGTSLQQVGVIILLISISVLFIAASLAVLITNHQARLWRAPGVRGVPWGTAASTLVLGLLSWQLQSALVAIRSNRFDQCLNRWRRGAGAAVIFLLAQALNVRHLAVLEGVQASQTLFVFCYDLLVGLHAAHVVGGLVPLALVHQRLLRRDYSSSRHDGVTFTVQYWHYLGIVWLMLLGLLIWIG
jgi:cytochrome c oxidase subunit 3